MDIVVVGRNTEVAERFRDHLNEKLAKVEQLAPQTQRIDVEVSHERNPRLADRKERVELTVRGRGPVVRAEASSSDRYSALDLAFARLAERLRRARDRQKDRRQNGVSARDLVADVPPVQASEPPAPEPAKPTAPTARGEAVESQMGDSPVIVRQKLHEAVPMSVDQALYQMELVGHPFFLFIDEETSQPCVVYHRHGWTYGVIRLDATATPVEESADAQ
ncbi:MAG: ribosome-associated translation inhibitor RaiA [bacterium]|nr:ribosome-associated translation inhibitor RaiA [bacterium]